MCVIKGCIKTVSGMGTAYSNVGLFKETMFLNNRLIILFFDQLRLSYIDRSRLLHNPGSS